ncbi:MAG: hypothetical protein ACRC6E_00920, partial [Fusobacteriaceae bacterium]
LANIAGFFMDKVMWAVENPKKVLFWLNILKNVMIASSAMSIIVLPAMKAIMTIKKFFKEMKGMFGDIPKPPKTPGVADDILKETAEEVAKKTAEKATKEAVKKTVENGAKKTAEATGKEAMKKADDVVVAVAKNVAKNADDVVKVAPKMTTSSILRLEDGFKAGKGHTISGLGNINTATGNIGGKLTEGRINYGSTLDNIKKQIVKPTPKNPLAEPSTMIAQRTARQAKQAVYAKRNAIAKELAEKTAKEAIEESAKKTVRFSGLVDDVIRGLNKFKLLDDVFKVAGKGFKFLGPLATVIDYMVSGEETGMSADFSPTQMEKYGVEQAKLKSEEKAKLEAKAKEEEAKINSAKNQATVLYINGPVNMNQGMATTLQTVHDTLGLI